MNTPNLFSIATSELSQDAFLAWLIQWANPGLASSFPDLHEAGKAFVIDLLSPHLTPSEKINKVEVRRQWEKIDVCAEVNNSYFIIIEDKVTTGEHSNQLDAYRKIAAKYCEEKHLQLVCVYLKTGSECLAISRRLEGRKWKTYYRYQFLKLLESNLTQNNIYNDFKENLRRIEKSEAEFTSKSFELWNSSDWIGFYRKLDDEGILKSWFFVNNSKGGFWNAIIRDEKYLHENHPVYLQIEQGLLCFKIGDVNENRISKRNGLHRLLVSFGSEDLPIFRPSRFGNGSSMTAASIPQSIWIQHSGGIVDIQATIQRIKNYLKLLNKI